MYTVQGNWDLIRRWINVYTVLNSRFLKFWIRISDKDRSGIFIALCESLARFDRALTVPLIDSCTLSNLTMHAILTKTSKSRRARFPASILFVSLRGLFLFVYCAVLLANLMQKKFVFSVVVAVLDFLEPKTYLQYSSILKKKVQQYTILFSVRTFDLDFSFMLFTWLKKLVIFIVCSLLLPH